MKDELPKRVRALLALRGQTITELARRLEVNSAHLTNVLAGKVPLSEALRERLARELGEEAWAFATGATDVLKVGAAA